MPEKMGVAGRSHGSQWYSALQCDEDIVGFSRSLFLDRDIIPTALPWTPPSLLLRLVYYDLLCTKSGGQKCEDECETGPILKSHI